MVDNIYEASLRNYNGGKMTEPEHMDGILILGFVDFSKILIECFFFFK